MPAFHLLIGPGWDGEGECSKWCWCRDPKDPPIGPGYVWSVKPGVKQEAPRHE